MNSFLKVSIKENIVNVNLLYVPSISNNQTKNHSNYSRFNDRAKGIIVNLRYLLKAFCNQ